MHISPAPIRACIAAALVAFTASAALAEGISPTPGPSNGSPQAPPPAAGDRITAGVVAQQLRAMGYQVEVGAGSDGEPRIGTTVDGYKWAIFFYGCAKGGQLEQRPCVSLQFYSGYTMQQPISSFTMNKFNAENRYIRAYTGQTNQGPAARISMDVMFADTGADPARKFRTHFNMMKHQTNVFRKLINFS